MAAFAGQPGVLHDDDEDTTEETELPEVAAAPAAPPQRAGAMVSFNVDVPQVTGGGSQGQQQQQQGEPEPALRKFYRDVQAPPAARQRASVAPPADGQIPDEEIQGLADELAAGYGYGFDGDYAPIDDDEDEYQAVLYAPWERVRRKKQRLARRFFAELLGYCLFLVLFCIVTYELRSKWNYWQAETVREHFLRGSRRSFYAVRTTVDFYDWVREELFPGLFAQTDAATGRARTHHDRLFAARYNRVVGGVRFRQLRVRKNVGECIISEKFASFIHDCYPEWDDAHENKESYGPPWNRTKFRWRSADALCDEQFGSSRYCKAYPVGRERDVYPPSGYVVDFPINLTASTVILEDTRKSDWIDEHTRAVFIDFSLFNSNVRLMTVAQLMVEFFPTGGVSTKASLKPISMLSLDRPEDVGTLIGEILLTAVIVGYIIATALQWRNYCYHKRDQCLICRKKDILRYDDDRYFYCTECDYLMNPFKTTQCPQCQREYSTTQHTCWRGYLQDAWNWVDLANLTVLACVLGIRYDLRYTIGQMRFTAGDAFVMLYPIAWQFVTANYLTGVSALLLFAKAFKYLGRLAQLRVLVDTVRKARHELLWFMVILVLTFISFGLAFNLGFGLETPRYRDMEHSVIALLLLLLGDLRYQELRDANRLLAPIYLSLFAVVVIFVLLNILICIIGAAYAAAWEVYLYGNDDFASSSLRLFLYDIKYKIFDCIGWKTPYGSILTLLSNLERCLHLQLTNKQMDDLRTFRNEVEHNPDNDALFNDVLQAFDRNVHRDMVMEDYEVLRDVVREHKSKLLSGINVDDDDWEGEVSEGSENDYEDHGEDDEGGGDGKAAQHSRERKDSAKPPPQPPPDANTAALEATSRRLRQLEQNVASMTGNVRALLDAVTGVSARAPAAAQASAPPQKQAADLPPGAAAWYHKAQH